MRARLGLREWSMDPFAHDDLRIAVADPTTATEDVTPTIVEHVDGDDLTAALSGYPRQDRHVVVLACRRERDHAGRLARRLAQIAATLVFVNGIARG
jgi:hypothetical protein